MLRNQLRCVSAEAATLTSTVPHAASLLVSATGIMQRPSTGTRSTQASVPCKPLPTGAVLLKPPAGLLWQDSEAQPGRLGRVVTLSTSSQSLSPC